MTRSIAIASMIAFATLSLVLIIARPEWVADSNSFFKSFVNHEFINVMGVILAITLASSAQIHLAFNRIEEQYRVRNALEKSRRSLRQATYNLIVMFVIGVAVVVVKPIAAFTPTSEAFFNMVAMFILFVHVLLLVSLTQIVFKIEPEFFDRDDGPDTRNR